MTPLEKKKTTSPVAKKSPITTRSAKITVAEVEAHVEENARHISENAREIQTNTKMIHILYAIIILLMVIIAGLAFWLGSVFSWTGTGASTAGNTTNTANTTGAGIEVTIIWDKRCNDCVTAEITQQFKTFPFLSEATVTEKDFSDSGIQEILKSNNITRLPAVILSDNNLWDGGAISPFLIALKDGKFRLELWEVASFDPFMERSERWFLTLDTETLEVIKSNSYVNGNAEAPITWLEYSDFGCSFCVKMHAEDKTVKNVLEKYNWVVNSRFQHMAFRNREVPEVIECIAETAWEQAFYTLIDEGFNARVTTKSDILAVADTNGVNYNIWEVDACIADGRMKTRIDAHMELGQNVFGVRGTPGNILINIETWEFELISGAYPQSHFEGVIERLK